MSKVSFESSRNKSKIILDDYKIFLTGPITDLRIIDPKGEVVVSAGSISSTSSPTPSDPTLHRIFNTSFTVGVFFLGFAAGVFFQMILSFYK